MRRRQLSKWLDVLDSSLTFRDFLNPATAWLDLGHTPGFREQGVRPSTLPVELPRRRDAFNFPSPDTLPAGNRKNRAHGHLS
jgi:hypothetical protein